MIATRGAVPAGSLGALHWNCAIVMAGLTLMPKTVRLPDNPKSGFFKPGRCKNTHNDAAQANCLAVGLRLVLKTMWSAREE